MSNSKFINIGFLVKNSKQILNHNNVYQSQGQSPYYLNIQRLSLTTNMTFSEKRLVAQWWSIHENIKYGNTPRKHKRKLWHHKKHHRQQREESMIKQSPWQKPSTTRIKVQAWQEKIMVVHEQKLKLMKSEAKWGW